MEIWKDLPGYEDFYQVSNLGNVKSKRKNKNMKFFQEGEKGYLKLNLNDGNGPKSFRVHRLVAITFLNEKGELGEKIVNHIDGNKSNNILKNLELVTYSENGFHSRNVIHKEKLKKVYKFDIETLEKIGEYNSASHASRELGVSQSCILMCCYGKSFSVKGCRWLFEEDYKKEGVKRLLERNKKTGNKKAKRIAMLNAETLEIVKVFEKCSIAMKEMNNKGIKYAAKNGTTSCGYKWRYLEDAE